MYPQFKKAMNEEIHKHCNYSAQHWIDEYERLTNDGWNIDGGHEPTDTMVENFLNIHLGKSEEYINKEAI